MSLYHVGRAGVRVGSVVGTAGYVDRLSVDDDQNLREALLESIRAAEFPDLPSRNAVVYAWEARSQAQRWHADGVAAGKPEDYEVIYVVEPAEDARVFRGDYGWLALTARSLDELETRARNYWSGVERTGTSAWEFLVRGDLIVEAILTAEEVATTGTEGTEALDGATHSGRSCPR